MALSKHSFVKSKAAGKPLSARSFMSLGKLKDDRPLPGTALLFGLDTKRRQRASTDAGSQEAAIDKRQRFFAQSASEADPARKPRGSAPAEPPLVYSDVPLPYPDIPLRPSLRRSYWRAQGQPLSIYNLEADRRRIVMGDSPATFEIVDNPSLSAPRSEYFTDHSIGRSAVLENDLFIESAADRNGVDADLIRAIIYFENSQGYYDSLLPRSLRGSIRPMNIRTSSWPVLLRDRDIHDPATNIDVGAQIVRGFMDRLDRPTVAAIGSLWHFAGRELVDDAGARISQIYEQRLWE